ncbi:MAG: hypothetical protein K6A23_16185 [Butyrivibrio sp.]|nr:hypothetical protein [Butyrivibrio sp.]
MNIIIFLILLIACFFDYKNKKIPIWTIVLAAVVSAMNIFMDLKTGNIYRGDLLYVFFPGLVLVALSVISSGNIGIGDGMMLLALSPALGIEVTFIGVCLAVVLCAVVSIVLLTFKRVGPKTALPFIPFLTLGIGGAAFVFG